MKCLDKVLPSKKVCKDFYRVANDLTVKSSFQLKKMSQQRWSGVHTPLSAVIVGDNVIFLKFIILKNNLIRQLYFQKYVENRQNFIYFQISSRFH